MNENENKIRDLDNSLTYYKKHMNEAVTGQGRKAYMDTIKKLEVAKQLSILKERNIKG